MNQSSTSAQLADGLPLRCETETRLRGSLLMMVRLVCVTLCMLSVGLFIASILDGLLALGYWVVAAFLLWRKSDDWVALLAAVSLALVPIVFNYGLTSALPSPWWFLANVLSFLGSLSFVLFYYVFPSGHFVPGFARWLLVVGLVYWGLNEFFPFPYTLDLYCPLLARGIQWVYNSLS
jgi:hypothetical protein